MQAMDFDQARYNMIEQQIRPWAVLDPAVLRTLESVARERFVPDTYQRLAYADARIPLGRGQTMMPPTVEGRLLQALELSGTERALEIGTGSGFITACLGHLARTVESVEIDADLAAMGAANLADWSDDRVALTMGDAAAAPPVAGPFDAIALTGAVPAVPQAYREALAEGGRLFAIIGDEDQPIMEAVQIVRVGAGEWSVESLFETWITPLTHIRPPRRFEF